MTQSAFDDVLLDLLRQEKADEVAAVLESRDQEKREAVEAKIDRLTTDLETAIRDYFAAVAVIRKLSARRQQRERKLDELDTEIRHAGGPRTDATRRRNSAVEGLRQLGVDVEKLLTEIEQKFNPNKDGTK